MKLLQKEYLRLFIADKDVKSSQWATVAYSDSAC